MFVGYDPTITRRKVAVAALDAAVIIKSWHDIIKRDVFAPVPKAIHYQGLTL